MDEALPSHVDWLMRHRGAALAEALSAQGVSLNPEDALRVLMQADPSYRKLATQWLCDRLLSGGFLWEDVSGGASSKAAETLRSFGLHRNRMGDVPDRNLASHSTLAGVYKAVKPFLMQDQPDTHSEDAAPGIRARRRSDRECALAEIRVLHRLNGMVVAVPSVRPFTRKLT